MNPEVFLFLSIGVICAFTFVSIAVWTGTRQNEREAYYKAESLRRIAEMPGEGARQIIEMMREEIRQQERKKIEGMKLGGVINIAVGIGLYFMMRGIGGIGGLGGLALVGLIPGLIGVALLVYALFLAPRPQ
jgi:hypothetical protein